MAVVFDLLTTKQAFLDAQGNPVVGGRLWTKRSGSNQNKVTTRDGDAVIENTNPIILDSRGEPPFGVFGFAGPYRLILAAPGDVTDPPTSPIWGPRDNVSGINDFAADDNIEWSPTGLTPTFISSTSFSVPGDQTAVFQPRRRCRATVGGGNRYATIQASVFTAITTVTLVPDSVAGLDASLSAVAVGIITATNTSQPQNAARGLTVSATGGNLNLPADADTFNIAGSFAIPGIFPSWIGRRLYLTHLAVQFLTHSDTFVLPGAVTFGVAIGDETVWEQVNATAWKLIDYSPAFALRSPVALKREVSNMEIVNTVEEKTIASFEIPGGTMGTNGIVTWRVRGSLLNDTGQNNVVSVSVKHGGIVIWKDSHNFATAVGRYAFLSEFSLCSLNSSTLQNGGGFVAFSQQFLPEIGIGKFSTTFADSTPTTVVAVFNQTVNTNLAQTFELTIQMGVAHTNSKFRRTSADLTLY